MLIPGNKFPDIRPIGSDGSFLIAKSANRYGMDWRFLYNSDIQDDFTINSFYYATGVYLAGRVITNPSFTITYSTTPSGATIISGTGVRSIPDPFSPYTFIGALGSGQADQVATFTISASSSLEGGIASATTGWTWRQMEYWGSSTGGPPYNQTFIKGLSNSGYYANNRAMQLNVATSGHFAHYAYRETTSGMFFKDLNNNLIGGFTLVSTGVSFINSEGYFEKYNLYKSDFPQIGNINFLVYN